MSEKDYRLHLIAALWTAGILFGLFGGSLSKAYLMGALGGAITGVFATLAIWYGFEPEMPKPA